MADGKESKVDTGPWWPEVPEMDIDGTGESNENSANDDVAGQSNEERQSDSGEEQDGTTEPSDAEYREWLPSSKQARIDSYARSPNRGVVRNCDLGVRRFEAKLEKPKRKRVLLRPSALSSVTTTTAAGSSSSSAGAGAFTNPLQPPKLSNPFGKKVTLPECDSNERQLPSEESESEGTEDGTDEEAKEKASEDAPPKFLPLVPGPKDTENNVNNVVIGTNSTSGLAQSFVFGQNLKERVTVSSDPENSGSSEKEEATDETNSRTTTTTTAITSTNSSSTSSTTISTSTTVISTASTTTTTATTSPTNENGPSGELLFSNAATACRPTTRPGLTLTQAAQEIEEANRANKRKYSQVTPLTGEEGETNVLQINCKLFAFDKTTSGWQERGRGTLRLNDRDEESRLVGRASGTQRLVLNTKIWPGMTAERPGPKSLRLTAMDAQADIKIFIVQAAPKEVDQLHSLLLQRLKRAQERQPKKLFTDH